MRGPCVLPECCALESVPSLRRSANGGHTALMNYSQTGRMKGRWSRRWRCRNWGGLLREKIARVLMSCRQEATRLYQSCDNNHISTPQWFLAGCQQYLKVILCKHFIWICVFAAVIESRHDSDSAYGDSVTVFCTDLDSIRGSSSVCVLISKCFVTNIIEEYNELPLVTQAHCNSTLLDRSCYVFCATLKPWWAWCGITWSS